MEKQRDDCEKYAHVTVDYCPKNKEERTVWYAKFLSNQFPTLFFKHPNLDIDVVDIDYCELDIVQKYRGLTVFAHTLDVGYYGQCARFIDQMQNHVNFLTALDLDEPLTQKALQRLFDKTQEEKLPPFKRDKTRSTLRHKLMRILSAKVVAETILGTTNETNFSGALKLNELREAYRALLQSEQAGVTQADLLKQINVSDRATMAVLYHITNPHSKDIRHRLLTAKLQQLLTPQNFIEQIRGKKQDYRSSWELNRDERRRENARQNAEHKPVQSTVVLQKNKKQFQPESQDVLFMWAGQGRNK